MKSCIMMLFVLFVVMPITVLAGKFPSNISEEVRVCALTILGEDRNHGLRGLDGVACVIQQRVIEYKISPTAVCKRGGKVKGVWYYQFSCWNNTTADELEIAVCDASQKKINYAIGLSKAIVARKKLNREMVKFANHYCTLETFPYWAEGKTPVAIIGIHKFFKL